MCNRNSNACLTNTTEPQHLHILRKPTNEGLCISLNQQKKKYFNMEKMTRFTFKANFELFKWADEVTCKESFSTKNKQTKISIIFWGIQVYGSGKKTAMCACAHTRSFSRQPKLIKQPLDVASVLNKTVGMDMRSSCERVYRCARRE